MIGCKRAILPALLLGFGLCLWPAHLLSAAEDLEGGPPELELEMPPFGAEPEHPEMAPGVPGPETDMPRLEPGIPGKDGSGPPPLATEKHDREDRPVDTPLTPAQRAQLLDSLFDRLRAAKDAKKAEPIANVIEQAWRNTGSPTIDLLMSHVDAFVLARKLDLAIEVLDAIAELSPDNAEAWHQRAMIAVMQNNLSGALSDLKRALAIEPRHYKARRDLGAVLQQMGDKRGALNAYREALQTHPFLDQAKRAADALSEEIGERGI